MSELGSVVALSPKSLMASPVRVNSQVSADLQRSVPQVAQEAQKAVKATQTDTVTISSQALKLADDKNAAAKDVSRKAEDRQSSRLASYRDDTSKRPVPKQAGNAYSAVA